MNQKKISKISFYQLKDSVWNLKYIEKYTHIHKLEFLLIPSPIWIGVSNCESYQFVVWKMFFLTVSLS